MSAPESRTSATGDARSDRETPGETLAYWTYRAAQWAAIGLPEPVGRWLFDAAAHAAFGSSERLRTNVVANQARVLGRDPSDRLVRDSAEEAFELYARYWYETFRIPLLGDAELDSRTEATGVEHLDAALAAGKGCVVALGHTGNWDAAGAWVVRHGYRVASVNEELRPPRLFDLFRRHREAFGVRILGLNAPHVGTQLAGLLAENFVVALLADRDLGGRGVEVTMFGAKRRLPSGPAYLSITTGAPLIHCAVSTTDRGWRVRMAPVPFERTGDVKADTRALTERLAAAFERQIAERPADWHLFQPGWS